MAEYRINDLAQESGVSVRNIRVYQERGLLPPPVRRGRPPDPKEPGMSPRRPRVPRSDRAIGRRAMAGLQRRV